MLNFYGTAGGEYDPDGSDIPDNTYLGGLEFEEAVEIDRIKILHSQGFDSLHFFEDQYFDPENVKTRLVFTKNKYEELQKTPGYMNSPVEKYIDLLQAAADQSLGIQTVCD